jgi:NitT/TauT family transport system permease protein
MMIVAWQMVTAFTKVPEFLIPSPASVMRELWNWRTELIKHIEVTTYETLAGFILAILIGVPLAAVLVLSRFMRQTIYPFIIALQSAPKIALAPLLVIWLGFGILPKIVLSFTMCIFPIVVNTAAGLSSVQPELLDLMRSLKASNWQILIRIRLPSALPYIFSSLKVAVVLALMGSVIAEFVGSEAGLGYLMIVSMQYMNTARAFGTILLVSTISILMFFLVNLIEMLVAPWSMQETDETIVEPVIGG